MSEGEEELNVGAVRLEEVASAANVSLSTASKALRGKASRQRENPYSSD